MENETEILKDDLSHPSDDNYSEMLNNMPEQKKREKFFIIFPVLISLMLLVGIPQNLESTTTSDKGFREIGSSSEHSGFSVNILSETDLSMGIKDTVYTDKDTWLELRIDQQMLYQHWRDGRVVKYPVSSGNKYLDRSIESRPGLFAIFVKEERHESSQYNNAEMYHFMPFNQGIGFHSLNGTGYYGNLGVRPSSHGCIRMRHDDVKKLFKESPLGTIVLAHRGYSARTIGFAPKDFENKEEYSTDDYKKMLAENLANILNGDFYMKERKFFVIDPSIIPRSGVYMGYDRKIPEKQKMNKSTFLFLNNSDLLSMRERVVHVKNDGSDNELDEILQTLVIDEKDIKKEVQTDYFSDAELIKKYFHNPIGILPYFPPKKD
ncbi:MAG: L,D-transpeptidase [Ignavibacteriae bacterium]|nr:L,D-transpeptidase [Ignavibacteriota bacterium]